MAIVANTTWNIYNFRQNILERLQREGYTLYVIAPTDKYIIYLENFPEVNHIPLEKLSRKSTSPIQDLWLILELYRIYRRIRPDLVLHYTVKPNVYGGIVAGILHIPSIAVVTGLGYAFIHKGWIRELTKILYRLSAWFHQKVLFENQEDLDLFVKQGLIRQGQGLSVKGCGVDTRKFVPVEENGEKTEFIFTFIGRLLYDKGIREYVEAARLILGKYDHVKFWIIGDFDAGNPASIHAADLKIWVIKDKIVHLGFQKNIPELISQSDCIVLPSYREAIARALTEAMSMEKPVIAGDTAGCREAVNDGENGFLVPIRDAKALAEKMEDLLKMKPEQRKLMGKKGRQKVLREFDDRLIAEEVHQRIREVLTDTIR